MNFQYLDVKFPTNHPAAFKGKFAFYLLLVVTHTAKNGSLPIHSVCHMFPNISRKLF